MNNLKCNGVLSLGNAEWRMSMEADGTYVAVKVQEVSLPNRPRATIEYTYQACPRDMSDLWTSWSNLRDTIRDRFYEARWSELEAVWAGLDWIGSNGRIGGGA